MSCNPWIKGSTNSILKQRKTSTTGHERGGMGDKWLSEGYVLRLFPCPVSSAADVYKNSNQTKLSL